MKKVICIILCVSLLMSVSACGLVEKNTGMENVSNLRNYFLVGNSDNYYVEMLGGKKESPLVVDGSAGKLKDYVKIKVLPKSGVEGEYKYHIGINEQEFSGSLTKEVAGGYYVVSLTASDLAGEYRLTITLGEKKEIIVLKSQIAEGMISYKEAREIAEKELKEKLTEMTGDDGNNYEIYIKFIEGEQGSMKYFWYVAFMSEDKMCACLIDPLNKKVVAKRA